MNMIAFIGILIVVTGFFAGIQFVKSRTLRLSLTIVGVWGLFAAGVVLAKMPRTADMAMLNFNDAMPAIIYSLDDSAAKGDLEEIKDKLHYLKWRWEEYDEIPMRAGVMFGAAMTIGNFGNLDANESLNDVEVLKGGVYLLRQQNNSGSPD